MASAVTALPRCLKQGTPVKFQGDTPLLTDFKKVLAEYIWNGFDARATEVCLDFESNKIGHISFHKQ